MSVKNYSQIKTIKAYKRIKSEVFTYNYYIFDTVRDFLQNLYLDCANKYKNDPSYSNSIIISLGWSLANIKRSINNNDRQETDRLIEFTIDEFFEWWFG